jgi:hypothetical protein
MKPRFWWFNGMFCTYNFARNKHKDYEDNLDCPMLETEIKDTGQNGGPKKQCSHKSRCHGKEWNKNILFP